MKVSELLKLLENIKINENKIDERYKIAEYLAQKTSQNDSLPIVYIMTKDKKIYGINLYEELLKSNKISPDNALIYTLARKVYFPAGYYFPFLADKYLLAYAYLSKLGLEKLYYIVPAIGLKYVSVVSHYPDIKHVVVEVADIDNVAANTNLPTLIRDILGTKQIDRYKVEDIVSQFSSQKLFAGYDFNEARDIINRYDISLAKEVRAIKHAYNHIFQPYRVVYDLKAKQFIPA